MSQFGSHIWAAPFWGALASVLLAVNFTWSQPTADYKWEVNAPIPDNDPVGVSDTRTVPDDLTGRNTIADVNVDLFIEHTWQGDVVVSLIHAGVTVPLLHRPGDSQSTGLGFSQDNLGSAIVKFILDDEAASFYDSAAPNGLGSVSDPGFPDGIDPSNGNNTWRPYGASGATFLSDFDGVDKRGDWTLLVSDRGSGDVGTLVNWSLHIAAIPEPTSWAVLSWCGLAVLGRRRHVPPGTS